MLHTKFQGDRLRGSGEEDIRGGGGGLPYMGMTAILVI